MGQGGEGGLIDQPARGGGVGQKCYQNLGMAHCIEKPVFTMIARDAFD